MQENVTQPTIETAKNEMSVKSQDTINYGMTMWSDTKSMNAAMKVANLLAKSQLLPEQYIGHPENCLIAIDIANRMRVSPLLVAQNLYIVRGKPGWSGSFAISAINNCGKFSPLDFVYTKNGGGGCYAQATRLSDGKVLKGTEITLEMAKNEGWSTKPGSKWLTMSEQMLAYRAGSFFARAYCPEVLLGVQTIDEIQDVNGYADEDKSVVTIELNKENNNG
jgi:hypothetical protein